MENFVFNLFSDKLSKIILDFSPDSINANFLSGRGSITDVRLNVDLINDYLRPSCPFIEFVEIELSELRIEVTSYTNLKKAPIVLVIGEIRAVARESLEYRTGDVDDDATKSKNNSSDAAPPPTTTPTQQYGILQRIIDNLSVKVGRISLSFSSLGKFKTRRSGPWTPPALRCVIDDVEWISVCQSGHPGTPEEVWAHNNNSNNDTGGEGGFSSRFIREGPRSYIIHKRMSAACRIDLAPGGLKGGGGGAVEAGTWSSTILSDAKIEIHLAYTRRLRDSGVSGADMDVRINDVDVDLDASLSGDEDRGVRCDLSSFVHMLIGLLHCYYRDRSFVDPLLPDGVDSSSAFFNLSPICVTEQTMETVQGTHAGDCEEMDAADAFLPEVALMDEVSDESDFDEDPEEQDVTSQQGDAITSASMKSSGNDSAAEKKKQTAKSYERKRKAVIVIASGAQKFENLSWSLSLPRIKMKLRLPSKQFTPNDRKFGTESESNYHSLELLLTGLEFACIWPKNPAGEMGGHVQGSIKYFHILETAYRGPRPCDVVRVNPLLRLGRDVHSLSHRSHSNYDTAKSASKCDEFPMMEDMRTSWTWDQRKFTGHRAFAFKSTISFIDETLSRWSKTNVQHEASLGELDIVLDSKPLQRLSFFFSDTEDPHNVWFDERWLSGLWQTEISPEVIAFSNKGDFYLMNHIQPLPSLLPSTNKQTAPLSSDLRSVTAHLDSITVRLPNPMHELSSFRMSDVLFSISEATILVNSHLPSSFLSGEIATYNIGHDFPHDSSDISCSRKHHRHPTVFRMQISLSDCHALILPMQAYSLDKSERAFCNLIAPTNVTVMISLENDTALSSPKEPTVATPTLQQFLILSVLIQKLQLNVELRNIYYALETIHYHAENVIHATNMVRSANGRALVATESSVDNIEEASSSIICIHIPDVEVLVWCDQAHSSDQSKHIQLCRLEVCQFEFGIEMENMSMHGHEKIFSKHKCFYKTLSVEVCDRGLKMVKVISFGNANSMVDNACFSCFPNNTKSWKGGFRMRKECIESADEMSSALSVEFGSLLSVELNVRVIEFFLGLVPQSLLSPVFIGHTSQIGKTLLGSALMSTGIKVIDLLGSNDQLNTIEKTSVENSLFRLTLHRLILHVSVKNEVSFGLSCSDVEIASGITDIIAGEHLRVIEKNCGNGRLTWLKAYHLSGEENTQTIPSRTFYLMRSTHGVIRVPSNEIIVPLSRINWSSPVGLREVSTAPPFDLLGLGDLIHTFMVLGMPFSTLYFKLYTLTPQIDSDDFSLASAQIHDSIGSYHCKMHDLMIQLHNEVDRLRFSVFSKEKERVGALALASCDASGWVRVAEQLSFSHRLFTSASFWKYWCMIDNNLIILYETPGARPSFVVPLRASSQLRSFALSTGSGIVGEHVHQKGFAVLDSDTGSSLFFVATDYDMWVKAIASALKKINALDVVSMEEKVERDVDWDDVIPKWSDQFVDPFQASITKEPDREQIQQLVDTSTVTAVDSTKEPDFDREEIQHFDTSEQQGVTALKPSSTFDSDSMENIDMDEISLGCDKTEPSDNFFIDSALTEDSFKLSSSTEPSLPVHEHTPMNEHVPMREKLGMVAEKSKLTGISKFGSALKSAKGNILAASEIGLDSVKHAMATKDGEESMKRGGGQSKMSLFKLASNTKMLTTTMSAFKDHDSSTTGSLPSIDESSVSSRLSSDVVRKKLSVIDQSMTSTMRRLKIDEKVNQLSAAVKNGVANDPLVKHLSSRSVVGISSQAQSNEISKRRLGIGEERITIKSIRFDARETFSASSDLPLKIKSSIAYGEPLLVDDELSEIVDSLQQIEGCWVVSVNPIQSYDDDQSLIMDSTNNVDCDNNKRDIIPSSLDSQSRLKFRISATDISDGISAKGQSSVEKTITEVLTFNTHISEMIANHLPTTAGHNFHQALLPTHSDSSILQKLSPFDMLRTAGSLLQKLVDSPPSMMDKKCKLLELFFSVLFGCHLPEEVVLATKGFLGITDSFCRYDSHAAPTNRVQTVNESFDRASNALSHELQPMSRKHQVDFDFDTESDQAYSSLLHVIMEGYTTAVMERDKALASLAAKSLINENEVMSEYLKSSDATSSKQAVIKNDMRGNKKSTGTDEEMMNLCKQLGNEIESRTAMEMEINRLHERLEFEQKIAQAKEAELRAKLASYEKATQSSQKMAASIVRRY